MFSGMTNVFRLERLEERTVLSTLTVLNNLDSGLDSLRAAIEKAVDGDTITFDKNVRHITLTSDELVINKSLDIKGPGVTISGNDAYRVFDIGAGKMVTLAGLTIAHGRADGNTDINPSVGGGILNSGNLMLINDVLSDNQAVGDANVIAGGFQGGALGGAIETFGQLTVTACQFINNQALGASGKPGVPPPAATPPALPRAALSISLVAPPSTSTPIACSLATWPGAATTATAAAATWLVWAMAALS